MGRVMADAEFPTDDCRHPPGRPYRSDESVRFGALGEQRREGGSLGHAQLARLAAARLGPQPLPTALPRDFEPLTHGAPADAERGGDAAPRPALLVQLQRPQPAPFLPVPWRCIR